MNRQNNHPTVGLRALEPEDLELLYQIENDTQLWAVGATNVPYSRYVLHDYIANSTGDIYADKQVRLIVELEGQQTVGIADLINFDPRHLRAEIGLLILPEYRGKGIGGAILEQLEDYARRILLLHQIYAVIGTDNEAATRLFEHRGYLSGTVLHDWLYDGRQYHDARVWQRILS